MGTGVARTFPEHIGYALKIAKKKKKKNAALRYEPIIITV